MSNKTIPKTKFNYPVSREELGNKIKLDNFGIIFEEQWNSLSKKYF